MIVSNRGVCFKYTLSATQETIFTTSMDDNIPSALSKRDFHTYAVTLPRSLCTVAGMDKRLISVDNSSPFLSVLSHLSQVADSILDYISVFHEQRSVGVCHFPLESQLDYDFS